MDPRRRRRRVLSPEQKWQAWLEVTTGELTQADAARKWGVDVATIVKLRKVAKGRVSVRLRRFQAPGRRTSPESRELDEVRRENERLSEALKELAVELALVRGKSRWG